MVRISEGESDQIESLEFWVLAKNQHTPKDLRKNSTRNASSSKIGHNFRKLSGPKIEPRKMLLLKHCLINWYVFLNNFFLKK